MVLKINRDLSALEGLRGQEISIDFKTFKYMKEDINFLL